jgi:16S rRNA (guanine966-N2)-methyltransferase
MLGTLVGRAFLDLFAGSGGVGLEAASRGAAPVVLVENSAVALGALRTNVTALALASVEVRADSVERVLSTTPPQTFDVVYLDPPYADPVDDSLAALVANGWLSPAATVVVERASRDEALTWPAGITPDRSRRYGDSTLWYGRRS